jgi:type I restriction enzyme, S subunit
MNQTVLEEARSALIAGPMSLTKLHERLKTAGSAWSESQHHLIFLAFDGFKVTDAVRGLRIYPLAPTAQQTYIGDKVRQAERLRTRARGLEKELLEKGSILIPLTAPTESSKKGWRINKGDVTDFRLNPEYFRIHHIEQERLSQRPSFAGLDQVVERFSYGTSTKAEYVPSGSGIKFIRGCDLDWNHIRQEDILDLSNRYKGDVGNNLLGPRDVLITRSGTVGISSAVPDALVVAAYGSFMIRLTVNEGWNPVFVAWVLNSWLGQRQIRRLESGAVQLNVNIEELKTIRIWSPSFEIQQEIVGQVNLRGELEAYSVSLITAAKFLVEALIEGLVSEADLITVQKALEAGDRTPDREILSRLTRKGMDTPGEPPLFPDLESLYNTLNALKTPEDDP